MYVNFVNICVNDILACVSYALGEPRKISVSARHERNKNNVFLALT